MCQSFHELAVSTRERGLLEITRSVEQWISQNYGNTVRGRIRGALRCILSENEVD
jgi:hypothetical protein